MHPFRHIGTVGLAILLLFAPLAGSAQDQGAAQQQGQSKQAQQKSETLQGKLVAIPNYVQQKQGQQDQQGSMQGPSSTGQGPFGLVVTDESFLSKISPGKDEQLYLLVFRQGTGTQQGMGSDSSDHGMGSQEEDTGMGSSMDSSSGQGSGQSEQQAGQWLGQKVSVRGTLHDKAGLQAIVVEQISAAGSGSQSKGAAGKQK